MNLDKDKIEYFGKRAGYRNQAALANALGISRPWLNAVLNGEGDPSVDLLRRMCEVLDCTLSEILIEDPNAVALAPA